MGDLSKHFSRREFHCTGCSPESPCARGGIDTVHASLIPILEDIRTHFDKPITVNSGYRCSERNKAVGGAQNSQHLYGCAADIVVQGVPPSTVYAYLDNKGHPGGLGLYKSFTHVDVRRNKSRWTA